MSMIEKMIETKDWVTKSNLPASDYVINPYVGCPHACKYCYACFMKRFTKHTEQWGDFIDIKHCENPIKTKKLIGKTVFLSSVTDCYNKFEEKYCNTRNIITQLSEVDCQLTISTKSSLILRDIDLLRRCKNLTVAVSVNTLDEQFKNDMDHASSIADRIKTLKVLYKNGIYTVLFMSPIFPEITNYKEIINCTFAFTNEYWFENLNLRGNYKQTILIYIKEKHPQYSKLYDNIYQKKDLSYWENLSMEIEDYCSSLSIKHVNYFYHSALVKEKKGS